MGLFDKFRKPKGKEDVFPWAPKGVDALYKLNDVVVQAVPAFEADDELLVAEVEEKDSTGIKRLVLIDAIHTAQINFTESRDGRNVLQGSFFAKKDTNRADNFKLEDGTVIGLNEISDSVSFDDLVTAVQDYLAPSNHIMAGKHFAHDLMIAIDSCLDMTTDVSNNGSSQDRLGNDALKHPNKNRIEFHLKFKFWVDSCDSEKLASTRQEKPQVSPSDRNWDEIVPSMPAGSVFEQRRSP